MGRFVALLLLIPTVCSFGQSADSRMLLRSQLIANSAFSRNDTSNDIQAMPGARCRHSASNIAAQFVGGAILGPVVAIPSLFFLAAGATLNADEERSSHDSRVGVEVVCGTVALAFYTFGSAVGVHYIAKAENERNDLPTTWLYSAAGGAVAALAVVALMPYFDYVPTASVAVLFFPAIGAMVYTCLVADWPATRSTNPGVVVGSAAGPRSYQDPVQRTTVVRVNLVTLTF